MTFCLLFTDEAKADLESLKLKKNLRKRYKAVLNTLIYLENNPRHPSLHTHKYTSLVGPNGEEVFEAYVENKTPAAYRLFWHYGPLKNHITVIAITPHL